MTHYKTQVWLHVSPKAKIFHQQLDALDLDFRFALSSHELFLASCGMGLCSKLCKEWQFPFFYIKIKGIKEQIHIISEISQLTTRVWIWKETWFILTGDC